MSASGEHPSTVREVTPSGAKPTTFSIVGSTPGEMQSCRGSGIERAPALFHQVWAPVSPSTW